MAYCFKRCLSFDSFRYGYLFARITTKIALDDKTEKTGHDLLFTLSMIYGKDTPFEWPYLRNFAIINNKNRNKIVYEIYIEKDGKQMRFWHVVQVSLFLSPSSTQLVRTNFAAPHLDAEISEYKIAAKHLKRR